MTKINKIVIPLFAINTNKAHYIEVLSSWGFKGKIKET